MIVSIIIPVFNGESYIYEAIKSALDQYLPESEFEVIVVDDGSTDLTAKICMSFEGQIKYILKENGGTASALNAGIAVSKGRFMAS